MLSRSIVKQRHRVHVVCVKLDTGHGVLFKPFHRLFAGTNIVELDAKSEFARILSIFSRSPKTIMKAA